MTIDELGEHPQVGGYHGEQTPHHRAMGLRIVLDGVEPPCGVVRAVAGPDASKAPDSDEVPFVGWLGLLRALAEVVAHTSAAPLSDHGQRPRTTRNRWIG